MLNLSNITNVVVILMCEISKNIYDTDKTVFRIRNTARRKNIKPSNLYADCGLAQSSLSMMKTRGSWISSITLARIADYLDVSVDYLLGRTDEPSINKFKGNNININNNSSSTISNINVNSQASSDEIEEMANMMKGLSLLERARVVLFINQIKNKET